MDIEKLVADFGGLQGDQTISLPSGLAVEVFVPRAVVLEAMDLEADRWRDMTVKAMKNEAHPWHQYRDFSREEWRICYKVRKIIKDVDDIGAFRLVAEAGGLAQIIVEEVYALSNTASKIRLTELFEDAKKKLNESQSTDSA